MQGLRLTSVRQRHLRTPTTGRWQAFSKAKGTCCQVMDFIPDWELLNGSRAPEHGPGPGSLSLAEAPQNATTALESSLAGAAERSEGSTAKRQ